MDAGSASPPSPPTRSSLIAPTTQQLEEQFPGWAISQARLNVLRARVMARTEALTWRNTEDVIPRLRALLERLNDEGDTPVFDELTQTQARRPFRVYRP